MHGWMHQDNPMGRQRRQGTEFLTPACCQGKASLVEKRNIGPKLPEYASRGQRLFSQVPEIDEPFDDRSGVGAAASQACAMGDPFRDMDADAFFNAVGFLHKQGCFVRDVIGSAGDVRVIGAHPDCCAGTQPYGIVETDFSEYGFDIVISVGPFVENMEAKVDFCV